MKNKILVACAALALVGCAENKEFRSDSGASGSTYQTSSSSDTNNLPATNNVQGAGAINQTTPNQTPNQTPSDNNSTQGNQNSPQNNPSTPSSGDTLNRGNQL